MRVVFDTNVLARAHPGSTGPARRALLHTISALHVLVLSSFLLWELQRILAHPRIVKSFNLNKAEVAEYIENLSAVSILVSPAAVPEGLLRDPTDRPVLGTVIAGRAEVLCTRDAYFYEEKVQRFCVSNGISVVTDLEFLERFVGRS